MVRTHTNRSGPGLSRKLPESDFMIFMIFLINKDGMLYGNRISQTVCSITDTQDKDVTQEELSNH